jgi:hypothetical protein
MILYLFLAVNASLRWLINVVGFYLVQVFLLLIDQQSLLDFFRYHWLENCANFTPTQEDINQYSANCSVI